MNVSCHDISAYADMMTANFGSSVYSISHFCCQSLQFHCEILGNILRYPSIIRMLGMSPETLIDREVGNDLTTNADISTY